MNRGAFGPLCDIGNSIRCKRCTKVQVVADLIRVNGTTFAKSRGGVWQIVYYYCQCNNRAVVVYNEGRGILQVIEANAELVF